MLDDTFDREPYRPLKQAVDALARVCDGANARDDRGFDGTDTRAGHLYASIPLEAWPLSAFHRAWRWAAKYRRQLEQSGVDCALVPEPPRFENEDRQISVPQGHDAFFVVFPYNTHMIDAFRRIAGNELHLVPLGEDTRRVVRYRTVKPVPGAGQALLEFAEAFSFRIGPGVRALAASCDQLPVAEEQLSDYRVTLESGAQERFALYFPRVASLNEEAKAIPGRTPSFTGGFHWVIPKTLPALSALHAFLERHPNFVVAPEVREHLESLAELL